MASYDFCFRSPRERPGTFLEFQSPLVVDNISFRCNASAPIRTRPLKVR